MGWSKGRLYWAQRTEVPYLRTLRKVAEVFGMPLEDAVEPLRTHGRLTLRRRLFRDNRQLDDQTRAELEALRAGT